MIQYKVFIVCRQPVSMKFRFLVSLAFNIVSYVRHAFFCFILRCVLQLTGLVQERV